MKLGVLRQPEGVDGVGVGGRFKREDVYMLMADAC